MIVRSNNTTLLLITQPDHAALARRIMEHWTDLKGAERRESILRATGEHDGGWIEIDVAPIVDRATGQIQDFIAAPLEVRQGVWAHAVARLADDPWAAALVAHHAAFVYDRFHTSPDWQPFLATMAAMRDALLLRVHPLVLADLERDYTFVRLGDLASLTFCTASPEEQRFADCLIRLEGPRLLISPDPFGGRTFPLEISAVELPNERFESTEDAARAFHAAESRVVLGSVAGA